MASSKEDGTAAAAEQLNSISLEESVERKKEPDTNEAAEKSGTPTNKKFCSWCEKKSDTVKKCTACKCVWYCDKECQNKHRKEHKKECRRIKKELDKRGGKLDLGTEKEVGPIGKVPPREECPICMRALPMHTMLKTYVTCCGKFICGGCDFQHKRKSGEQKTCAFCRTPMPNSDEEILARVRKRVERNDPIALLNLALKYAYGFHVLPVDQAKCIELLRQSADLGFSDAQHRLGEYHYEGEMGLEQNKKQGLKYYEKAAKGGDAYARYLIAYIEEEKTGDRTAAMRHLRLSASGGFRVSIEKLINCFEAGMLQHGDLAEALQAMYRARNEMSSDDRNRYIDHLKETGKYGGEFDGW
jgi:hypothetical protein